VKRGALIVGLGGNVGTETELRARFDEAVADIARALSIRGGVRRSRLYRSAPVGAIVDQPAFLNGAAAFDGPLDAPPVSAMAALLEIERRHGRDRTREQVWGPRRLDLDVLAWADRQLDEQGPPRIAVPHPRLVERRFALEPLRDLVGGDWIIPGVDSTVDECLGRVADQAVLVADP